jgi:spore coat polysaccharide biosynthesis protein SpsF
MKKRILNIVTVIQARTGSKRLPGKVLMEAAGKPLLLHMIERVGRAKLKGRIVIATTQEKEDDVIESLCSAYGIDCFRGSTNDLIDRHLKAALYYSADIVIKIPSDCPLIDPAIIDRTIEFFLRNRENFDYVSNLHPATYPDGCDVEIFSFNALYRADKNADKDFEREHTTPYIWRNTDKFRIGNVCWEKGLNYSASHRFVLDYKEDYEFIREVYENLYYTNNNFSLDDILDLLRLNSSIRDINSHLRGISWYSQLADIPGTFKTFSAQTINNGQNGIKTGKDKRAFSEVA